MWGASMTRKQLLRRKAELNRNKLRYTLSGTERAIEELAEIDEKLKVPPDPAYTAACEAERLRREIRKRK